MKVIELSILDASRIICLYEGDFSDGWNKDMLVSAFNEGRFHAFGMEEKGELIGFIGITLSADFADIESVYVDKNFRRQKIANTLVDKALNFICEKGLNKTLLEVKETNENAIALYEKAGFKRISIRKKYYQDGSNAIIMAREI